MLCIIVYEFYYKQELYLVILIPVDKKPFVGLYNNILPFILAISQKIEGHRQLLLNTKKVI